MESDADGDGKISRDEAPRQLQQRFDQMDANGDGFIERQEMGRQGPGGRGLPR